MGRHPLPAGQENGQEHANAAAASGAACRHEDPVPVSVLVVEAREAGVVDWLADQIMTVDSDARTTLATIRDLCLGAAMACGDLHSGVEVRRDGAVFRCG
jgi:hypothetical protein